MIPTEQVQSIYGNNNYDIVKSLFITHFEDQRNECSLLSDLNVLRQGNKNTSLQFYIRVVKILNLLSNYVSLHANVEK